MRQTWPSSAPKPRPISMLCSWRRPVAYAPARRCLRGRGRWSAASGGAFPRRAASSPSPRCRPRRRGRCGGGGRCAVRGLLRGRCGGLRGGRRASSSAGCGDRRAWCCRRPSSVRASSGRRTSCAGAPCDWRRPPSPARSSSAGPCPAAPRGTSACRCSRRRCPSRRCAARSR